MNQPRVHMGHSLKNSQPAKASRGIVLPLMAWSVAFLLTAACDPITAPAPAPAPKDPDVGTITQPLTAQIATPPTLTTGPVNDWKLGDVTGDGKADLVTWGRAGQPPIQVARSTGKAFDKEAKWGVETCATCIHEVADVNGDGKADIVSFAWGEKEKPGWADVSVYLSNGNGLGPRQLWHSSFCIREQVCKLADVNGDGKADLVAFTPITGLVWVSLSDGARFGANAIWHKFFCILGERCLIGDANGDKKIDLIAFKPGAKVAVEKGNVLVAPSNGSGFGAAQTWHGFFCIDNEQCLTGDMNGDGRTDIFLLKQWDGGLQALSSLSNGRQFINDRPFVWSDAIAGPTNPGLLADVTGDRKADLVTKQDASNGTTASFALYPNSAQGGCLTVRDPATGSCAKADPKPNPQPPAGAKGYSEIAIYNCSADHRPITVYIRGSSKTLDPQYNSTGTCPFEDNGTAAEPETFGLGTGSFEVAIVDPEMIGCDGRNDPTYQACLRQHFSIPGDKDGPTFTHIVQ